MENNYQIKYLSSFKKEFEGIIRYIKNDLENDGAAQKLYRKVFTSIITRSNNPESFRIYKGLFHTKYSWYRINIDNFSIFYIVKDNVMEVAHILYSRRDIDRII